MSIQLVFKPQIISYHGDKLTISRFSSVILNGIPKIRIQRIHVASVPRDLNSMTNGTLDAACGGLIFLRNRRVENFRDRINYVRVLDGEEDSGTEILVALDMRGDADLVDDASDLSLNVRSVVLILSRGDLFIYFGISALEHAFRIFKKVGLIKWLYKAKLRARLESLNENILI